MAALEHNHSSCTYVFKGSHGHWCGRKQRHNAVYSAGERAAWSLARRTAAYCCWLDSPSHLEVLTRSTQNGFCWHDREAVVKRRPAQTLHMINLSSYR
jgi:hypothetical protein